MFVDGDVDKVECWLKRKPEDMFVGAKSILVGCKTFVDMPQQVYYVELEHTAKTMYLETIKEYVIDELGAPNATVWLAPENERLTDKIGNHFDEPEIPDQITVRATIGNDYFYANLLISDVVISDLDVTGVAIMCQNLREANGAFYLERTRKEALIRYTHVLANALAKKYDYWEGIDVIWDEIPF